MRSLPRLVGALVVAAFIAAGCGPDPLAGVGVDLTTTTSTPITTTSWVVPDPPPTVGLVQPAEAPFDPPGADWDTVAPPEHFDGAALDALVERAVGTSRWGPVTAVVVAHEGQLIAEGYRAGHDETSVLPSYELASLVVNALIGTLARQQQLELFEPWWVEEWWDDDRFAMTPHDVLRHVAGFKGDDAIAVVELRAAAEVGSVGDSVVNRPFNENELWQQFAYSSAGMAVLAQVLEESPAVAGDLARWADEQLFSSLELTSVRFEEDASGAWKGFEGADMTARDFVRLGTLYASGGMWGEEFLLSPDWVGYSTEILEPSTEYGAGFWIDQFGPGTWSVRGDGQRLVIVPGEGLVIGVFSLFASDPVVQDFTQDLVDELRL